MRFVSVVSLLCLLAAPSAAEVRNFTVQDLVTMDRLSDPQVSPDGKWIAFVRRTTDLEADKGRTDIWLIGVDGEGLRQLTTDPTGDFSPRWSPDGKYLYYLSGASGSTQIWRVEVGGGKTGRMGEVCVAAQAAGCPATAGVVIAVATFAGGGQAGQTAVYLGVSHICGMGKRVMAGVAVGR